MYSSCDSDCASGAMNAFWHSNWNQFHMAIMPLSVSHRLKKKSLSAFCVVWELLFLVGCTTSEWVIYEQCTFCVLWAFDILKALNCSDEQWKMANRLKDISVTVHFCMKIWSVQKDMFSFQFAWSVKVKILWGIEFTDEYPCYNCLGRLANTL